MLPPLTNGVLVAALLAWTWFLTRVAARREEASAARYLIISLVLVVLSRGLFMAEVEANPDTSTWLAAAGTVVERSDAAWTLLTYSDSRPLTVLPLVVALWVGAPLSYIMAETVGLICWLGTIALCFRLLRLQLRPSASLLVCWTLALFIGTTGHGDDIAYNSEAFAVFLTTLGTYSALRLSRMQRVPPALAGLYGLLLGIFVFEKMQIVPVGFVLAAFLLVRLVQQKAWGATALMLAGGVLPAAIISGWYATRGEWHSFWDTYFWRYYYYSYSEESSPLAISMRFRLGRILRFVFGNGWSALYLCSLIVVTVAASVAVLRRGRLQLTPVSRRNLPLSLCLSIATTYAVIQAGNDYHHYLLLLFVPLLHTAASLLAITPAPWRRRLAIMGVAAATVQGAGNAWLRQPLAPTFTQGSDRRVAKLILAHSAPSEPIVVWGYADRFHVLANRPMGYRYANTFYVYMPLIALKEHDLRHFMLDLETHRPALFVDAMVPGITLGAKLRHQHENFPVVAAYVNAHYRQVAATDGVRLFRRLGSPAAAPAHTASSPPPNAP